jgi:hypothetical protein
MSPEVDLKVRRVAIKCSNQPRTEEDRMCGNVYVHGDVKLPFNAQ